MTLALVERNERGLWARPRGMQLPAIAAFVLTVTVTLL